MARQKREVDEEEIDEIISLKLKELNGIKRKLTYNSVCTFNERIANNPEYKRLDGKLFNKYGYDFWATSYKGEDYFGKKKIDEVKNSRDVILAGEVFNPEIQDLLVLVDNYHKNPHELSKRLVKLMERDRKNIAMLREQNERLNISLAKAKKNLELFEEGFATMFYSSSSADNSLYDVMSLKRSADSFVYDELRNMFNRDESRLGKILNPKETEEGEDSKVVDMQDKLRKIEELEDSGF
ncbi:hypothetical protein LGK97_10400 [Clostridium sp. CS001]|jgi:hypothetical protein|uniref:hypothetical protein n=1 Tax=Clostridium sp. CS001 TaxID=2880648 RepID=UPI001CF1A8C1|nr:hypothetical protein [Clostridium sp. CS001]MCB2290177.1 hypothetical protein [Clostridium sp. CS001]